MPRPSQRTRSLRKIKVRLPGGELKVRFEKRKPSKPVCGGCGKPLSGVPRDVPSRIRKLPKTKKRPERPYGGNLCPSCSREKIKERIMKVSV